MIRGIICDLRTKNNLIGKLVLFDLGIMNLIGSTILENDI